MRVREIVTFSTLLLALLVSRYSACSQNLVRNGGFEEGAVGWSLPAPLYSIDTTVARSGKQCLKYHNEVGGPYLLAGQGLALRAGKCYRMSVWVKTEGILSSDTGATISMEWSGKQGYLGGSYPPGITGTSDWRQIVFHTSVIPEGITGGSVIVYGRPGTSGTAWFDDVEVSELDHPLASFGFADSPPGERKKTLLAGLKSPEVRLRAELSASGETSPEALMLFAKVYASGPPVEVQGDSWRDGVGEIVVPAEKLPFGEYPIELGLATKADKRPITSDFFFVHKKRPMRMDIVSPNSAGALGVGPEKHERVTVRVTVERQDANETHTYQARLSLLSAGKEVVRSTTTTVTDKHPRQFGVSLKGLPFGLYNLRCDLYEKGSREPLVSAKSVVTHANPTERPANATWIGPNRMLMVNDKPFFPMGFYILSSFESVFPADKPWRWDTGGLQPPYYLPILDRLSKSNFNCFIDYGSTLGGIEAARKVMDAAHERGLRTIFSVKDLMRGAFWEAYTKQLPWKDLGEATRNVVREFRGHPSLLGWYVNDEVIQPEHWQGVVDVFQNTRKLDPWHPTYAVHYDFKNLASYREACDIIGTDPYSLTGDIGFTARSWHECRQQLPPEQPFWAVVQCFGPGYEFSRPSDTREPTYDEERAATMAAIAEGATGIIYYCFHSLQRSPRFEERFGELNRIAGEVQSLLPIIALSEAAKPVRVESGALSAMTKRGKSKTYVLLASTLRTEQDVELRLPRKPKRVCDVKTGELFKTQGARLVVRFKALDAKVLEME